MSIQRLEAKRKLSDEAEREPCKIEPNSNYKDKYVHLIGHEAELEAARRTETNKSYGFGMRRMQIKKWHLSKNNILCFTLQFPVQTKKICEQSRIFKLISKRKRSRGSCKQRHMTRTRVRGPAKKALNCIKYSNQIIAIR